jgi:RNA polymerase sigma-70 factor (ECF subfamily)
VTVTALQRGDPEVLADLLAQHGHQIQAVAYLILRDRAEAEDVLMDTLIVALERASSLRDPGALRTWLLRIATNQALGRRRRGSRILRVAVPPDVPVRDADSADRVALMAALETLPVRTRAAVVLHYYADLTVADVARTMGTSPNTVKTQLKQALERLRGSFAEPSDPGTLPEVAHG